MFKCVPIFEWILKFRFTILKFKYFCGFEEFTNFYPDGYSVSVSLAIETFRIRTRKRFFLISTKSKFLNAFTNNYLHLPHTMG